MKLNKMIIFASFWLFLQGFHWPAAKEEAKPAEAPKAASTTVKIGFMGALTGDVAMYGKPTLEGMKNGCR